MIRLVLSLVFAGTVIAPDAVVADERLRLNASWSATEMHESNLFLTPNGRESDLVSRVRAGLNPEYRTTIWTVLARCAFDLERFANHPELSSIDARQGAGIELVYRPSRTLSVSAGADWTRTRTAGELNEASGLVLTRARAQRTAFRSSIVRQPDRPTRGTLEYSFTEDRLAGGFASRTHAAGAGTERHLSARDTARAGYHVQRFWFQLSGEDAHAAISHTATLGLTRSLTRQTEASIEAGPRLTAGALAPEISVGLRRHSPSLDWSLAYARTQAVVIGLAGTAKTQSVTAALAWDLRRAVRIHVAPAYIRSEQSLGADVYRLAIGAVKPVADGLTFEVTFETGVQRGSLFRALADTTIPHQTLSVSLVRTPVVRSR